MEKISFNTPDDGLQEFYVIEETKLNGITYLLVSDEDPESEEALAYVFKEVSDDDEVISYIMVENERELAALSDVFNELLTDDDFFLE